MNDNDVILQKIVIYLAKSVRKYNFIQL